MTEIQSLTGYTGRFFASNWDPDNSQETPSYVQAFESFADLAFRSMAVITAPVILFTMGIIDTLASLKHFVNMSINYLVYQDKQQAREDAGAFAHQLLSGVIAIVLSFFTPFIEALHLLCATVSTAYQYANP